MEDAPEVSNPFALMMDPQAVLHAMEHSERLKRLHSRICRPLDTPTRVGEHSDDDAERDDL